jgi:hypothetical protein
MSGASANDGAGTSSQSLDSQEEEGQNLFATYLFGWSIFFTLETFVYGVCFDDDVQGLCLIFGLAVSYTLSLCVHVFML